jgi:hypothetical protein
MSVLDESFTESDASTSGLAVSVYNVISEEMSSPSGKWRTVGKGPVQINRETFSDQIED